ncbi:unnamed protein product [Boreogadus saida]
MIRTGAPRALGSLNILKSTRAAERPCLARSASPGSRCDIHGLCLMLPYKKRRGAYGKGGDWIRSQLDWIHSQLDWIRSQLDWIRSQLDWICSQSDGIRYQLD